MRRGPRLPLEQLAPYVLPVGPTFQPDTRIVRLESLTYAPLDWREVFGNDHPVELEVGFGKGLFLLTAAHAHPDVNFVGVEIVRKYQLFTATRLAKRGVHNVRVACADALQLLPRCVATASLQAVHVYFPDPWWKKRHHKRRIFTAEFVAECARVLRGGGQMHVATDVQEYAQVMSTVLAGQPTLHPLPPASEQEPAHDLDYLTNFERKFRKQGKTIFRMSYERSQVRRE
ncbi:MAG TPA: tRNA (guanosine(46)-N7)-methyltransferase TrmB [Gemmataceae bacterium]|nr:tRNA (guanosine(46)-N7)-methyltransferase TrmB [Gemmataceae bacterium]